MIKYYYGFYNFEDLRMVGVFCMIKFVLGENLMCVYGEGCGIQFRICMGVEQVFRKVFLEVIVYMKVWEKYNSEKNINLKVIVFEYNYWM